MTQLLLLIGAHWRSILLMSGLGLTSPLFAVTVLHNCFASAGTYEAYFERDLSTSENVRTATLPAIDHLVGSGSEIYAQCSCPATLTSSTVVSGMVFAGSPLAAGSLAGYGYLTDKFDVDIDAYSDAINSLDGAGLTAIYINQYPTTTLVSATQTFTSTEESQSVCSTDTQPVPGTPPRGFKWNVINVKLYVKSPILGQETIPATLVESSSACLYFGNGMCTSADAQPVANIWLSGTLSAPLSCTINEGSTLEVAFNAVARTSFTTRGAPPDGFTLKEVDIRFHCDNAAVSNTDKIKLTLSADQGVVDNGDPVIAKAIGREDLGVRVYDSQHNSVQLDGSTEFAIQLDAQGDGNIKMQAAPVATTGAQPQAGPYESNVTIRMDLK